MKAWHICHILRIQHLQSFELLLRPVSLLAP